MLATLTVTNAVENPTDSPFSGNGLTLREALDYVNGTPVLAGDDIAGQIDGVPGTPGTPDLIKFDPRVFGFPTAGNPNRTPVIELLHGELLISNSVTIDGAAPTEIDGNLVAGPGWEGLTIDALAA